MILRLKVENFKALRRIDCRGLGPFHILVGPNGSGKTTFLEAIEFVRDCIQMGPRQAVESRVPDFRDLTFKREGGEIRFQFWFRLDDRGDLHYLLTIVGDDQLGVRVKEEVLTRKAPWGARLMRRVTDQRLLGKTANGTDFYRREDGRYIDSFTFGSGKLALSLTPPDESRYPSGIAVQTYLLRGVRYLRLDSTAMRQPCPATRPTDLELDGSNLARVVGKLIRRNRKPAADSKVNGRNRPQMDAVSRWTRHLRYALEDLDSIGWATREPDNAEYLTLRYREGLVCPSWLLSDGTLRMLALTLPAFLPAASPATYMVEEPENGVHPKALEIILGALQSIPNSQVLAASHSPLVVQQVGAEPLLCFSRGENGVELVAGARHPALKEWDGEPDLASVFSARLLG